MQPITYILCCESKESIFKLNKLLIYYSIYSFIIYVHSYQSCAMANLIASILWIKLLPPDIIWINFPSSTYLHSP